MCHELTTVKDKDNSSHQDPTDHIGLTALHVCMCVCVCVCVCVHHFYTFFWGGRGVYAQVCVSSLKFCACVCAWRGCAWMRV